MNVDLRGLDKDGLSKMMTHLDKSKNRDVLYASFEKLAEGEFLLAELNERKEHTRDLYSCIPPDSDNVGVLLASIQAYERETNEWISRITGGDQRVAEVDEKVNSIKKMVKHRQEMSKRSERFVPARIQEQDNGME